MIPSLLGYLDREDRISLEKLIGKGDDLLPFSFKLPRLYLGLSLSFRLPYKGGSKIHPPFGSFKKGGNEMEPLNES